MSHVKRPQRKAPNSSQNPSNVCSMVCIFVSSKCLGWGFNPNGHQTWAAEDHASGRLDQKQASAKQADIPYIQLSLPHYSWWRSNPFSNVWWDKPPIPQLMVPDWISTNRNSRSMFTSKKSSIFTWIPCEIWFGMLPSVPTLKRGRFSEWSAGYKKKYRTIPSIVSEVYRYHQQFFEKSPPAFPEITSSFAIHHILHSYISVDRMNHSSSASLRKGLGVDPSKSPFKQLSCWF